MSVLLLASALMALAPRPLALSIDAKDGDTIRGERTFRVSVTSDSAINQVEFYVNGELRDTDTSTPYEFKLDTVPEAEGPVKLRFKAYTVENKSGEKTLSLKVDNEIAKGADYHVGKANDFLSDGKFADARDEGKIALKIDKASYGARVALARAYTGLNEFDQAQLQAEEARTLKPNDPAGLNVLAGINVRRAFLVYAKPGADRAEVLKGIKDALKGAVESRRTALDAALDAMPKTPALAYGDAALNARRYGATVTALAPAFIADQKNAALANRLAYAQLRTNRRQDALNTLNTFVRAGGTLDAYGYALKAVALADGGDDQGSDDAMREAVLADSENLGVRTAQAFIALKRGNVTALSRLSAELSKDQGQRPDVRYIQMAYAARTQDYSGAARAFEVGVLAEPAAADLFVEYANDAIAITQRGTMDAKEKAQHYAEARVYFETALLARPEASEALSGLAMVAAFEGKPAEAVRYAQAAVGSAPEDAGAHYALAAAQALNATALRATNAGAAGRASAAAQAANLRAGRLDAKYLGGRQIPDATAVWRYLDSAGRPTVLAAPTS